MFTLLRAGALLTLGLGLNFQADPAQAAPAPPPPIEAQAKRLLQDMSDYLKAAKSFSFKARIQFDDSQPDGQKILRSALAEISLRRPNGLHVQQVGDMGTQRLWFDGQQLALLDPSRNSYAVEKLSGHTDKALDYLSHTLHFTPPLADLLYLDVARALIRPDTRGALVGQSLVDGTPCTQLAFVTPQVDWQIWIEAGRVPLLRQLVITYKNQPNAPQYRATLSDWDFLTRLPDSLFRPEWPANATQIPFPRELERQPPTVNAQGH